MNCINEENIQKYIDGELKQPEIVLLEQHLNQCGPCSEKVGSQRSLSINMKSTINSLVDENIVIPAFEPSNHIVHQTFIKRNKYVISISALIAAASLLLFFGIFRKGQNTKKDEQLLFISTLYYEVDANRPVTKQPLLIHITKPDGNQIDYIMN
jgi:hypothetical protein